MATPTVQPTVLSGATWERLRQTIYEIPPEKHAAVVGAVNVNGDVEALMAYKIGKGWQIAGSLGYVDRKPVGGVLILGSW